jgi:hypothetical protein
MRVQIRVMYDIEDRVNAGSLTELLASIRKLEADTKAALPPDAEVLPPQAVPSADAAKANRQAAAANARAAKGKKGGPVEQVLGPEEAGDPAQANGQDQPDDDMGLVPPAMSPGEARDAALALVRQAYAAGHVAEVKALQKEYNVAKFYDVPVTEGHAFYQRVMQLLQSVGIQA